MFTDCQISKLPLHHKNNLDCTNCTIYTKSPPPVHYIPVFQRFDLFGGECSLFLLKCSKLYKSEFMRCYNWPVWMNSQFISFKYLRKASAQFSHKINSISNGIHSDSIIEIFGIIPQFMRSRVGAMLTFHLTPQITNHVNERDGGKGDSTNTFS